MPRPQLAEVFTNYPPKRVETHEVMLPTGWAECHYCHKPLSKKFITLDHVVPRVRGGKRNKENLVSCCWLCNANKGSMPYEEFKRFLEEFLSLPEVSKEYLRHSLLKSEAKGLRKKWKGFLAWHDWK